MGTEQAGERSDGRVYPRFTLPGRTDVMVAMGPLGSPPASGVPVNISRGGLQARTGVKVFKGAEGADCVVRFHEAKDRLRPLATLGTVRRIETSGGYFLVAIEFAKPLESLSLSG
ncbi:MAG: PilZ domain-containing protein [Acidobacteriota bacterium]